MRLRKIKSTGNNTKIAAEKLKKKPKKIQPGTLQKLKP
jgi:hypothetical protein